MPSQYGFASTCTLSPRSSPQKKRSPNLKLPNILIVPNCRAPAPGADSKMWKAKRLPYNLFRNDGHEIAYTFLFRNSKRTAIRARKPKGT